MSQAKKNTNTTTERIQFARFPGRVMPRTAGSPFPIYSNLDPYQAREVPKHIADLMKELSRRGNHGISIAKIDPDDLAEMDLFGIPYILTDWDKMNTWGKKLFVVPSAVYRFAEDHGT